MNKIIIVFLCFSFGQSIPISEENRNSSSSNEVSSKYANLELEKFANLPPNASEEISSSEITEEDRMTQEDWGGNCTVAFFDKCKVIKSWFGYYLNPKKGPDQPKWKNYQLDCKIEPTLCMKNGLESIT
jgi:hypothetical protein